MLLSALVRGWRPLAFLGREEEGKHLSFHLLLTCWPATGGRGSMSEDTSETRVGEGSVRLGPEKGERLPTPPREGKDAAPHFQRLCRQVSHICGIVRVSTSGVRGLALRKPLLPSEVSPKAVGLKGGCFVGPSHPERVLKLR